MQCLQAEEPLKLPAEFYEYVNKFNVKSFNISENEVKALKNILIFMLENSKNFDKFLNMDVF